MAGHKFDDNLRLSACVLGRILPGVIVATKTLEDTANAVRAYLDESISKHYGHNGMTVPDWLEETSSKLSVKGSRGLAQLTIAIAFLQQKCRQEQAIGEIVQSQLWNLIRDAITTGSFIGPDYAPSRSAQGFLSLPLCSLVENGNINQLYRLHIWLPDGQRGVSAVAVHSHQPFAQSWILHGSGTDISYSVSPTEDYRQATHASYAIAWNDGKSQSKTYTTNQLSSTVVNTGKLMRAMPTATTVHTRGMAYIVPAAAHHTTVVKPDELHATLFFFDAHRGFEKNAGVLGPKDGEENTQLRDPAGVTARDLVDVVERARSTEVEVASEVNGSSR